MANKNTTVSFEKLLDPNNFDFSTVQIIDEEGNVVNEHLLPELSDDELVVL